MRRFAAFATTLLIALFVVAPAARACGFLVSASGAVRLQKTTTFVTWADGIERYITNFTFEGDVESFGSIIPLPAEPTDLEALEKLISRGVYQKPWVSLSIKFHLVVFKILAFLKDMDIRMLGAIAVRSRKP